MDKRLILCMALALALAPAAAQDLHGTLRGKYEYQTAEREGRFEVRTARVSVTGSLSDLVDYKAEIDLCDEGSIKMLDAYTRLRPFARGAFTIGQMRVPFTIDAHRSPHQQFFANRSFIAKQVGNVRDVGATLAWEQPLARRASADADAPRLKLEAGLFNGSGLTGQKDFWTRSVNFSAKAQLFVPSAASRPADFRGLCLALSAQKVRPEGVTVMMYDAGAYFRGRRWHVEAEYLLKTYAHDAFSRVHAVDAFAACRLPLRSRIAKALTPLVRYDYMSDHSNGRRHEETGALGIDDCERGRLTAGATLALAQPRQTDVRVNFEKYFYPDGAQPKSSERDKLVVEFVTRF